MLQTEKQKDINAGRQRYRETERLNELKDRKMEKLTVDKQLDRMIKRQNP